MSKPYKTGEKVSWKWGQGLAEGKITSVSHKHTELETNDSKITKNGTDDNPALTITQDDGTKVLKLASELS